MRAKDVLPDHQNEAEFAGVTVRKGTVAAFIENARIWTDATKQGMDRTKAEQDILEAVPALRALGLFDVMAVRDENLAALIAACPLDQDEAAHPSSP